MVGFGLNKMRRRHKKMIKEIITWVIIILLGVLIFSFVFAPERFYDFKDRISNTIHNRFSEQEIVSVIAPFTPCYDYEINKVICQLNCGIEDMDYSGYKCEKGRLVCQCKK